MGSETRKGEVNAGGGLFWGLSIRILCGRVDHNWVLTNHPILIMNQLHLSVMYKKSRGFISML
jgi:hypothetical protein